VAGRGAWRGLVALPAPLHRARGRLAAAADCRDEAVPPVDESLAISRQCGLAWDEARTLEVLRAVKV